MGKKDKPDILLFLSDQHNAQVAGYEGDTVIRTPHLDRLSQEGASYRNAYTACPLCVPARMSMLLGRLPEKTGIFTNDDAIASDDPSFVHGLAVAGYDTVLCGRMHFVGPDQRHGFTERLVGDITPLIWGRGGPKRTDLGPYVDTLTPRRCLEVIGGGNSPVLAYDLSVVQAALEYLERGHEKPQFIVVGTYGPHFPYVAPPELYSYYRHKILPPTPHEPGKRQDHPAVRLIQKVGIPPDVFLKARAAYYGMVERTDELVGKTRDAWERYLAQSERKGLFIYSSDHGDQIGERSLIGKETFYEGSARVPLLFAGDGVDPGARQGAVSLMDLGPTLCDLADAPCPPGQDGVSLLSGIMEGEDRIDRVVLSQCVLEQTQGEAYPGAMAKRGDWKYIHYPDWPSDDLLFDTRRDPKELTNLRAECPDIALELLGHINRGWSIPRLLNEYARRRARVSLLERWGSTVDTEEAERWQPSEAALMLPEITD